jgi:hypothetical protein
MELLPGLARLLLALLRVLRGLGFLLRLVLEAIADCLHCLVARFPIEAGHHVPLELLAAWARRLLFSLPLFRLLCLGALRLLLLLAVSDSVQRFLAQFPLEVAHHWRFPPSL